jgi:hypothetical protein
LFVCATDIQNGGFMKRISVWMASAAASLLAVPAAAGEDIESQLAEMQELVKGLQQKVDAQSEQLDAQSEQLEQQGQQLKDAQRVVRSDEQESKSGLSTFVDSIEVTGAVIGSYNFNFNTPTDNGSFDGTDTISGVADQNAGQSGRFMPYHRDANSFQLDQAWFGLGKPATEESRGGFQFDIFYGATASSFGAATGDRRDNGDSASDYVVDQAYVEYLAPIGNVNLKLGKFDTPLGAENNRQWANFNITHGIVDTMLQPVNHLGVIGTVPLEGFGEIGAGLVNSGGSTISAPDDNQEKSYLATLKLGDNRANIRGTFVYGSEETIGNSFSGTNLTTGDQLGLADATAWFNPTDTVSLWANYDYLFAQGTGYYAHGIAVAGRVAVLPELGIAVRGEYIREHSSANHGVLILQDDFDNVGHTSDIWSVTGTVDYALTEHLKVKSELRWDRANGNGTSTGNGGDGNNQFPESNPNDFSSIDQLVWLIAAEYIF